MVRMLLLRMDDVYALLADVLAAVGDRSRPLAASWGIGGTAAVNDVTELHGAGSVVVVRSDVAAGVTRVTVNVRAVGDEEGEAMPEACAVGFEEEQAVEHVCGRCGKVCVTASGLGRHNRAC